MIPGEECIKKALSELAVDLSRLSRGDCNVQAHIIGSVCVGGMLPIQTEQILRQRKIPDPVGTAKQICAKTGEVFTIIKDTAFGFEDRTLLKHFIVELGKK